MRIISYLKSKKQAYTQLFQETWTTTAVHGPKKALDQAQNMEVNN